MRKTAAHLIDRLNRSNSCGSGNVQIKKEWDIDEPIIWPSSAGLELHGASMHHTILHWTGPADTAMFVRRDVRDSVIANFEIRLETPLLKAFETGRKTITPGSINTTNNHTKRVFVEPGGHRLGTYHQYGGIGYDGFEYLDKNNELNVDEDIYAGAVTFGIVYNGHQCKANHALRCRFQGHDLGTYGIVAWGGSYLAQLCGGGGFLDAFFRFYNQTDSCIIQWPDIERCARLIHTTGPTGGKTGATQAITIEGGSYRSDLMPPDRVAVWAQHGGIIHLRRIQMGAGEPNDPIIKAEGFSSHISAHGVDFGYPGSTPATSFAFGPGGENFYDIGMNTYHDASGNSYTVRGIPGVTDVPSLDYAHGGR